ncbi:MAG: bifunctional (p)ppGpp synthetase/guanosine-3',5'-bis(diphosphate) 3'-pyrophosphohydrolase [Methylococcales bacterium]|nr:bifunctional (p)ppGpp synthetase/guanosine-3',5'-bis(diphosphate) 3'-pyrophosphohydrolase [Methylococcales bacterium]
MKPITIPLENYLHQYHGEERSQLQRALAIVSLIADDPNYIRPKGVEVASVLMGFHVDLKTILAAILSDPRLITLKKPIDIEAEFGETVANLVQDVNWLNNIRVYSPEMASQPNQAETLRRMLLSMTQDVRSVLIKLAYRIQRLRNLPQESHDIRHFIAHETLDIYAPIANRLGVHQFKWELEDMGLRYLDPATYKHIAKSLAANRTAREACISNFISLLKQTLAKENIACECYGRPKHIYSIWKKMQRKNLSFDQLYDLLAVRVIVDNLMHCYTVLGIVHSLWQTIPKEFDDYIANPKENGYQSLHTVVLDANGNRIEVQIRTQAMHDYAELGVAAHWSYKEGGKQSATMEKSVAILRKMLDTKNADAATADEFKSELFSDRVYVLTPAGKLVDLIKGSTPLDFAYAVHTDIGHRCRGAKVNGRIVPLTYVLHSGEQVEILTVKEVQPNRNWIDTNLGYLKSPRSIQKVKNWFKGQEIEGEALQPKNELPEPEIKNDTLFNVRPNKTLNRCEVTVAGLDNVQTSFAQCCHPVSGDEIIGYISHHKGIIVHRLDCKNILNLEETKQPQLVTVAWGNSKASHAVPIVVHAFNAQNLLTDVSQVLAQMKIHIFSANLESQPDFSAALNLTLQIANAQQLNEVVKKISQLPAIVNVSRL